VPSDWDYDSTFHIENMTCYCMFLLLVVLGMTSDKLMAFGLCINRLKCLGEDFGPSCKFDILQIT